MRFLVYMYMYVKCLYVFFLCRWPLAVDSVSNGSRSSYRRYSNVFSPLWLLRIEVGFVFAFLVVVTLNYAPRGWNPLCQTRIS